MTTTQMNVRIDGDMKARGDAVFSALGLTPTDVVRAVWGFAAEHGEAPCIVASALQKPADASRSLDLQYRALISEQAHNLVADFRAKHGLAAPDRLDDIDYRSMREEAWQKRLAERGLA